MNVAEASPTSVAVLSTGVANVASVRAAFSRLGCETIEALDAAMVQGAPCLVVPGVGSFAAAMASLLALNVVDALRERLLLGRPTLCICLGMQLLGRGSEESPSEGGFGADGLGIVNSVATRFDAGTSTPQLGWNAVVADTGCAVLQSGDFSFANSYRWLQAPAGWAVARCDHGGEFIAAVERGSVVACQFHPELSGDAGAALLNRWLAHSGALGRPSEQTEVRQVRS